MLTDRLFNSELFYDTNYDFVDYNLSPPPSPKINFKREGENTNSKTINDKEIIVKQKKRKRDNDSSVEESSQFKKSTKRPLKDNTVYNHVSTIWSKIRIKTKLIEEFVDKPRIRIKLLEYVIPSKFDSTIYINNSSKQYIRVIFVSDRKGSIIFKLVSAGDVAFLIERKSNICRYFQNYKDIEEKVLINLLSLNDDRKSYLNTCLTYEGLIKYITRLKFKYADELIEHFIVWLERNVVHLLE